MFVSQETQQSIARNEGQRVNLLDRHDDLNDLGEGVLEHWEGQRIVGPPTRLMVRNSSLGQP